MCLDPRFGPTFCVYVLKMLGPTLHAEETQVEETQAKKSWNASSMHHFINPNACFSTVHGHQSQQNNNELKRAKTISQRHIVSLTFKALARTIRASLQVMWTTVRSTLMKTVRSFVHCTSISWRTIWSKQCAALNDSFHSLQLSSFLSTTVAECLQGSSMRSLNRLQWVAPTHQPQNHQNRAHTVQANPLFLTLWKDPFYSSSVAAHLLSTWDIVAAIVGLCIHG